MTDHQASLSIVLDLASYRHRIDDIEPGADRGLPNVSLVALAEAFCAPGTRLRRLWVAAPVAPVDLGVGGREKTAIRRTGDVLDWWRGQVAEWKRSRFADADLRRLNGGYNGTREIGVDVLVAAGALEATAGFEPNERGVVLVCSHDSDLFELNSPGLAAPIVVAGALKRTERQRARQSRMPRIVLGDADMAALRVEATTACGGPRQHHLVWRALADPAGPEQLTVTMPSKETRTLLQHTRSEPSKRAVPHRSVVCIADPYGLFNAVIRAHGVADFPDVGSITDLVTSLAWKGPVGIRVTLPDLSNGHADPTAAVQAAWRERDANLDALALEFDNDGDAGTVQRRALLQPNQAEAGARYERDITAYAIKRQSTGLLLDLWSALRDGAEHVVLLSEDPDLLFALEQLPSSGVDRYERVVRVGLHSHRYRMVAPAASTTPKRLPFVVLTDAQSAQLCRVTDRPHGTGLRHAVAEALRSSNPDWRFERIDPESFSIVMSVAAGSTDAAAVASGVTGTAAAGEGRVEVNVFGLDELFGESAEVIERAVRDLPDVTLTFDAERPCAHPLIEADEVARPTISSGVVRSHWGSRIGIDTDRDGVVNVEVGVGHTLEQFPAGTVVQVASARYNGNRSLVDPGRGLRETPAVEVVEMTGIVGGYPTFRSVADDAAGPALPPPGEAEVTAVAGDRCFAVRRQTSEGVISWVVLSTALRHLGALEPASS